MACGMMLAAERPQIRGIVSPAVGYAHDVIDLRGELAAELAAVAVAGENLGSDPPLGAREAAAQRVRRAPRALGQPAAGQAGLQSHYSHPTSRAGAGAGCSTRSSAIARATTPTLSPDSVLARGVTLMSSPRGGW